MGWAGRLCRPILINEAGKAAAMEGLPAGSACQGTAPGLATAHALLQCADLDHKNCGDLRDALTGNFLEVKQASVVETVGARAFCVSGVALINPEKRQKFKEALRRMKTGPSGPGVLDVELYLETG